MATWRWALFQLADLWTNGVEPSEYAAFLVCLQTSNKALKKNLKTLKS
jgi:hypothetical protein